jgi:hypothetical protein
MSIKKRWIDISFLSHPFSGLCSHKETSTKMWDVMSEKHKVNNVQNFHMIYGPIFS